MFTKVKVKEVRKETKDTVSISFDLPSELKSEFNYESGQYVTIRKEINGEDVRRSYSLCSSPAQDDFRIGVKLVENGKMSSFLTKEVAVGDELELMTPTGNFVLGTAKNNVVAFAAGSGITPVISMVRSVLNSGGKFILFYGNRTEQDVIFKNELDQLNTAYADKFDLNYIYSRENNGEDLYAGRITKDKCSLLIQKKSVSINADGFYMCGPEDMIFDVSDSLKELGIDENKIHFELFTVPTKRADEKAVESDFEGESQVTVIMDGDEFEFPLRNDGDFILDASIENGADAPFSCKGAVCCTCKAQVIEGKATMDMNYALSDEEVEEGFILTCQARPASSKLVVDYDVS
ncbi:MAG: FAD-binding oxidoreductase [Vicingaceae bacterium]